MICSSLNRPFFICSFSSRRRLRRRWKTSTMNGGVYREQVRKPSETFTLLSVSPTLSEMVFRSCREPLSKVRTSSAHPCSASSRSSSGAKEGYGSFAGEDSDGASDHRRIAGEQENIRRESTDETVPIVLGENAFNPARSLFIAKHATAVLPYADHGNPRTGRCPRGPPRRR
jgi:hypothetical protein